MLAGRRATAMQLGSRDVSPDLAVKDLGRARKFYEDVLGLKKIGEDQEELVFESGRSKLHVYRSQFAGTNQATAVTWDVGDEIQDLAKELKGKGVTFEHYDMPGMKLEGDIHVAKDMKAAWFKDPDGNILCLAAGSTEH